MATYLYYSFRSQPPAQKSSTSVNSQPDESLPSEENRANTTYVDIEDITLPPSISLHGETFCDMYAHAVQADRSAASAAPSQLSYLSSGVAVVYPVVDPYTHEREFRRFQISSGLKVETGKVETELVVTESLSDDHLRKLLKDNAFCNLTLHASEKVSVCELDPAEMPGSPREDDIEEGEIAEEMDLDAPGLTPEDDPAQLAALNVMYEKYHEFTSPAEIQKRYALCKDRLGLEHQQRFAHAFGQLTRLLKSPYVTDRFRDLITQKTQQAVEELKFHLKAAEAKKAFSDDMP